MRFAGFVVCTFVIHDERCLNMCFLVYIYAHNCITQTNALIIVLGSSLPLCNTIKCNLVLFEDPGISSLTLKCIGRFQHPD